MKRWAISLAAALVFGAVMSVEADPMPPDVLARVKQGLATQWPNNFSIQKTLLDAQIQAYDELQDYSDPRVSPSVIESLKADLARQWPYNFSIQKTLLDAQVTSYVQLQAK